MGIYVDSSVIVSGVAVDDDHHHAVRRWLEGHEHEMVASVVAEVEVARAVRRRGVTTEVGERARSLVAACYLVEVSDEIRARAASLTPLSLRALDAIHVASALTAEVTGFFTFDVRQQVAAEESGLAVVSV